MKSTLIIIGCSIITLSSFAQVTGGRNNSETTPQVSKPASLSSGSYSGDVNLFSGDYNASIGLGSVKTPAGLTYSLSLNYSSNFSIGNTLPVTSGIPYGEGWNLNLPTISVETEAFNNFPDSRYCAENSSVNAPASNIKFQSTGVDQLAEGDLFWYSPYISIPGVASGRAIFKYIDVADNKTAVFELNTFENHVEIRFDGANWIVITADGVRYSFRKAVLSANSPANQRVFYYDPEALSVENYAKSVQDDGYSGNEAKVAENSLLPKQKYTMWYCDAITHRNQPGQLIRFEYQSFGAFNYFKEFQQERYKHAAVDVLESSTLPKDYDFTCYSDILLTKVESHGISGLIDRIDLQYATDRTIMNSNSNEIINFNLQNSGRLDSLYSFRTVYKGSEQNFGGWSRYQHTKANSLTNGAAVNVSNPYLANGGYLRSPVSGSGVSFNHSFLESPRLNINIIPGDIYELKSRVARNGTYENAGTFDLRVVTGDLADPGGTQSNSFSDYNSNNGAYYLESNYNATRGKSLYSTTNMALKWTIGYEETTK